MKQRLPETIDQLPRSPGVYLMKDRRGTILYIGKARDLRSRVRAYFMPSAQHSPKTEVMLSKVDQIDSMVTASEVEAYILESNLIKKNRPRYNILLRDDKHYPYLRLTVQEAYPRLEVVRKIRKDGARYFGPYVPGSQLRSTLELIEKTFPLRRCKGKMGGGKGRPCLNAQMGRCLCPCSGDVSKAEYDRVVKEVILFLQGKSKPLVSALTRNMEQASAALEFEKAAEIRDQIRRMQRVTEQQIIISSSLQDKDVFGIARSGESAGIQVLFVRGGKLIGKKDFFVDRHTEDKDEELLKAVVTQYYDKDRLIPPCLFIPMDFPESDIVEQVLSSLSGRKVRISVPQRGINRRLVQMAAKNAELALESRAREKDANRLLLEDLQRIAGLRRLPARIEAFDISNIQGEYPVASMVVFEDGRSRKSHYRSYRIQSVRGADDYAMMEEVLMRRYRSEDHGALPPPNLILIDGGKGQLNVLCQVSEKKAFLRDTDFLALAKKRSGPDRPADQKVDRIFVPNRREPIILKPEHPVVHLLQRIRDESHRFAVTYYRKLHGRTTLTSSLQNVHGVGKKRTLSLLKHFGSLDAVRRASLEELTHAPFMNRQVASRVYAALREKVGRA